ncbi:MAG: Bug family tripartite tricarboxylate transporter substrate binding protein [Xanthobacteraceae bacterium]
MAARSFALMLSLAIGAMFAAGGAPAQTYPDRLIKVVVPYPPGGPIDATARLVVHRLGPMLGQSVIVENRAGAGGALGSKAVAAAEPDGYTLLFGNASAFVVGPAVYRLRDYDILTHFTPVAKITEGYEVLVVAPELPAANVQELISYAKDRPGKLNFGSMGYGNMTHLVAELFKLRTGTDFQHVPYKGSPEAVAGLLAGQVHMLFGDVAGLLPHVREGKLRALAVSSATRNALAPELPTFVEEALPDFVALTFTGVVAPAATPAAIVNKLNAAINEAVKPAEFVAAMAKLGAEVRTGSPAEFATFLDRERSKWTDVITRTGIKAD